MSPRRQPCTLLDLSVKKFIYMINSACNSIEKLYPENNYAECEKEALKLKQFMMSTLPAR